jgi:hypothetical protein
MSKFENSSKEEVAKTVKQWLIDEGVSVEDHEDPDSDYNFKTIFGSKIIHIAFHKSSRDSLIVLGRVRFETDEQKMLRYTKTKRELLFDAETLQLQKTIFFDGLSKDRFFGAVHQISNCLQLLMLQFLLLGRANRT